MVAPGSKPPEASGTLPDISPVFICPKASNVLKSTAWCQGRRIDHGSYLRDQYRTEMVPGEEFRALGINFVSYTEGVDTTTRSGQLLFHVVGVVAQFERDLIAELVRAGMAHARAMGKRIGRPRAIVNAEAVLPLRQEGQSLLGTARQLDVPVTRVRRALVGDAGATQISAVGITGESLSR
jgi:hypothetical protein